MNINSFVNDDDNDGDAYHIISNTNKPTRLPYPSNRDEEPSLVELRKKIKSEDNEEEKEKEKNGVRNGLITMGSLIQIAKLVGAAVGIDTKVKYPCYNKSNKRTTLKTTTNAVGGCTTSNTTTTHSDIDEITISEIDSKGFNQVAILTINAMK